MPKEHACHFCDNSFSRNEHLIRHLKEDRCKGFKQLSALDIHYKIEQVKNKISVSDHSVLNSNSYNQFNINIQINPITKLSLDHITTDQMKKVIEGYDKDKNHLHLLLNSYLHTILSDKEHPENQAVKYVKKYPPTFETTIEDENGNIISVIKGLKDSCDLLANPVLDILKTKLNECIKKYKDKNEIDYDYDDCSFAIKDLRRELSRDVVRKTLGKFLQNDVLNNIQLKLSVDMKPIDT